MIPMAISRIEQIIIDHPEYIRFHLPLSETRGYDVEITVDYGYADERPKKLVANAWARVGDAPIKGFIASVRVPYAKGKLVLKEYDQDIIVALNRDATFSDRLDEYVSMCACHDEPDDFQGGGMDPLS
jgi:hypothetical protein